MHITLHIGNKEYGMYSEGVQYCIQNGWKWSKCSHTIVAWLWNNKQNVHELGHGNFLKTSLAIFLQSALIRPQGFWNYFHHQESGLLVIVQINTCHK